MGGLKLWQCKAELRVGWMGALSGVGWTSSSTGGGTTGARGAQRRRGNQATDKALGKAGKRGWHWNLRWWVEPCLAELYGRREEGESIR